MLALPSITAPAGFIASFVSFLFCSSFSLATGLLIAEVTLNSPTRSDTLGTSREASRTEEEGTVGLLTLSDKLLGKSGGIFVLLPYLFLHYSLLVAYISKFSQLVYDRLGVAPPVSSSLFTLLLGGVCLGLPTPSVDAVNSTLVACMIAAFAGLLIVAASSVDPSLLLTPPHWDQTLSALPIIALAFVYQNVVPVVVKRLRNNRKKVVEALVWGMVLAFLMFTLWDGAILGAQPQGGSNWDVASHPQDPLETLQAISPVAGSLADAFSLFTLATSFIGFALSLTDFIGEALSSDINKPAGWVTANMSEDVRDHPQPSHPKSSATSIARSGDDDNTTDTSLKHSEETIPVKRKPSRRLVCFGLALAPPLLFAQLNPEGFYSVLDYAGTYGVMSLFGILPVALCWQQRYIGNTVAQSMELVPGGKPVLLFLGGAATAVIFNQAIMHLAQHGVL
ncbi:hypothetical protein CEUSTIGMA_g756.t1 [Chlamydomonas eustigma]|uniref:Amino acid transporter transmembrane domain-containing protein n=1 Tax=Chlamydomonas eustigma TaxID=1157962 RepID=A0A250WRK5_9CHLO|nr:hypothetical protein CEUSTIGMA_g756.t1 [Chlamydomonas eustigma]|eukprot:GAX73302.1 hypothetical protein CEUSTIGMA_g756.t1 [Chlamydomonas eustigma]